jgi:hypothetical protein
MCGSWLCRHVLELGVCRCLVSSAAGCNANAVPALGGGGVSGEAMYTEPLSATPCNRACALDSLPGIMHGVGRHHWCRA